MRTIALDRIRQLVSVPEAIAAVRAGFVALAEGRIVQPEPLQLLFEGADGALLGDCHAKAARGIGLPIFVIKVATGFYGNAQRGLPVNDGLVLVLSSQTGRPVALLQDEGWLTQLRTAAAGALAAALKPVGPTATLGIVGTGTQALLQARTVCATLGLSKVLVLGRNPRAVQALCDRLVQDGLHAQASPSARALCHASDIVVTATPSTEPVLRADDLPPRLHIVALGADSPGKIELDPAVLARADIVVTDSHAQCLHHGDFGAAVRAGALPETADVALCDLLAGTRPDVDFASAGVSVIDLTGLGMQDLAVAHLVVAKEGLA